jgi:fructose-bisphosphate aldolase class I
MNTEMFEKMLSGEGLISSFSRALTEGLKIEQSDSEFNETLDSAIEMIYKASVEKHT